jgi:Flp pilus assembly protein protease CpaA
MKRLVSFVITAVVVIGVLVLVIVFSRHNGPGDSPRDDNNTKTAPAAIAPHVGGSAAFVRV